MAAGGRSSRELDKKPLLDLDNSKHLDPANPQLALGQYPHRRNQAKRDQFSQINLASTETTVGRGAKSAKVFQPSMHADHTTRLKVAQIYRQ